MGMYYSTCWRKAKRTRDGAEAEAMRLTEKDQQMVFAYECHYCGGWHCGRVKVPLLRDTPVAPREPRRGRRWHRP